ncbi:PREDICTED: hemicentin-2-like [Branchiostoma belcheri]|uniref:Hemicentin-2-like n=1 Tax=Branchiostoma belcheri TaxID=7741 RepID=A0A6P4XYA9_BRABE|nr:PREDICTED: hemicentin-2-like [Branchiostoma belcheri]
MRGLEVPRKVGQELVLRCLSSGGHPLPELTWYNGTRAFTGEQVRRQEREGQVEAELVIPQLTKWDNGMNLTCKANQPLPEITSVQEAWNILHVHYAPMVSVPITSVSVVEGEAAFLTCLVDGSPSASISWIKLGHHMPLVQDAREQTLRIRNTTRLDAGIYQCSAENGILPIGVGTVTLNVLYPPVINPSLEKEVTVQEGNDEFSLECVVDGVPEPRVRWRRKDTNLYWENPLRFHRMSYDVEGTYQCVATSDGFPLQAKDTFIDVVGKPFMQRKMGKSTISAAVGEEVSITCSVTADPLPSKIDWIWRNDDEVEKELPASVKSNIVITEEGQWMTSVLTIPDATVQNSGNYICTASNVFGSVRRNIRLDISGSLPMEIIIPSITAGTILLLTTAAVMVIFAKRRGWICKSHIEVSRPMPPVPKYLYKTGTIDSGVEDLQKLRKMYGTLKPRPPPRMDTGWPSPGLPNGVPVPRPPLLRGLEVPSRIGQELVIRCLSSGGHPLPELTLYNGTRAFTGEQVRRQEREGQVETELVIPQLTKWDNGMNLTCKANQPFPEITSVQESWSILQVHYPPLINPSLEKEVTVQQGNDGFSLKCLVDGNPEPRVRWRRKDANLYWENPLRFYRVSYDVEGTYQCVATSDGFSLQSKDTFIDVVGKPLMQRKMGKSTISAAVGEAVRMSCTVTADPLPSKIDWIWRNDDGVEKELPASVSSNVVITTEGQGMTSVLTIPDAAVQNSGNYICTASNVFGSARRDIRLDISGSVPKDIIIASVTAGSILLVTTAAVIVLFAKKRGWICKSYIDEPLAFRVPASRPMPPVPKYVYKTGTIDSGVEDLQELQEMYGTLKPRPPPRMDTGWTSAGVPNGGLVHSTSLPPYPTEEWSHRDEEDEEDEEPTVSQDEVTVSGEDESVVDSEEAESVTETDSDESDSESDADSDVSSNTASYDESEEYGYDSGDEEEWTLYRDWSIPLKHEPVSGLSYDAVPLPTAVLMGDTATLHCSFHDLSPEDVVRWDGPPGLRTITSGRRVDPNYPRHQVQILSPA